jgi:hypothetical protein
MVRRVLLSVALLLSLGCDDKVDPVSIPVDVPEPPEVASQPPETTSAPATSSSAPAPTWTGTYKAVKPQAPITACCAALLHQANSAKSPANKKLYDQVAALCYRRAKLVDEGKMTRAEALAQIRSSLLGSAPSSCY